MSDIQKFKTGGTPKSSGGKSRWVEGKGSSKTTVSRRLTRGRRPGPPDSRNPITARDRKKTFTPFITADNFIRQNEQNEISTNNSSKTKKKKKSKRGAGNAGDNEVTLPLPGPEPSFPSFGDFSLPPLPPVRVPDRDNLISLVRPGSNEALLVSVLFEELSAVEIVKFARNDTVDGINPQYSVISNLAELKSKLDPSYLIAKQRSDTTIDGGFSIRLSDKIPAIDYLFENNIPNYVYFDPTLGESGSLIIELENIDIDEIVEVEIDTSGTIVEVR